MSFVLVVVFAGLGTNGFGSSYVSTMTIDKTTFSFASDCQAAADALAKKFPEGKLVAMSAICLPVR